MSLKVPEGRQIVAHHACPERSEGEVVGYDTKLEKQVPQGTTHVVASAAIMPFSTIPLYCSLAYSAGGQVFG